MQVVQSTIPEPQFVRKVSMIRRTQGKNRIRKAVGELAETVFSAHRKLCLLCNTGRCSESYCCWKSRIIDTYTCIIIANFLVPARAFD